MISQSAQVLGLIYHQTRVHQGRKILSVVLGAHPLGSLSILDMKVYYLISVELLLLVDHISHCVSLSLVRLRIHNRIDIDGLFVGYALLVHVVGMLGQLGPQVDVFDGWGWEHGARENAPVVWAHGCGQGFLGDNPMLVVVTCLTLTIAVST